MTTHITANSLNLNGIVIGQGVGAPVKTTRALLTGETLTGSTGNAPVPVTTALLLSGFLTGHLGGLGLSNSVGTPNTVLDVAVGSATSSDGTTLLGLASAFTGSISGTWVTGTGQNKLDAGSAAADTWYHVWLIGGPTVTTDILFSTSATAPTMPTSYTMKRRLGSFRLDGSVHILPFTHRGDRFVWNTPLLDVTSANPGNAAVLYVLPVPPGVLVEALVNMGIVDTTVTATFIQGYASDPAVVDLAPASNAAPLATLSTAFSSGVSYAIGAVPAVGTDTASRIRVRLVGTTALTTLYISTLGWIDRRGRG
jgi:hypothetical protein